MTTEAKTAKKSSEPKLKPETSTVEEVVNEPTTVKAFGKTYPIARFNVGQLIRAMPHLAPMGYVLVAAANRLDPGRLAVEVFATAGEPALGLLSVAISEPVEWIEEQDDSVGALELLTATIEKNARYFFEPANVERIKAAFARLQSIAQTHGGSISIPS